MILLIFQALPEEVAFYEIPTVSDEHLVLLENAHGVIVNVVVDGKAADVISQMICDPQYAEDPSFTDNGIWSGYKVSLPHGPYDRVFTCGFYS